MLPCRYGALACWYVTSQIKSCVEIPYLSLWTKSIDCLSLFASLSLIFLCSPPHLTPQHIFSLCLFFFLFLCFFLVYWPCFAKKHRIIIFAIFETTYSTSIFVWLSINLLIYSGQTFSSSGSHVNWLSPF